MPASMSLGSQPKDFISLDSMLAFGLILIFVVSGGYMEHKKARFGNETCIALALGLVISVMLHYLPPNGESMDISFNEDVFFYVCLPPIIFSSGFNMRRKRFFRNIGYVLLFGVLGTIIVFFTFTGLTYGMASGGGLKMYTHD
jgi:NhaP-type Na+/H+ or K+/H+ antiporter